MFKQPNTTANAGVEYVRRELLPFIPQYQLITDCLAGEQQVKAQRTLYLPSPGDPNQQDAAKRYTDYITRAVFYNVAGRTLDGLVGRVFTRDPLLDVPKLLQPVIDDANGESVSFEQQTQDATAKVLALGGVGLHIDYPNVDGAASRADLERGNIRPTIHLYTRYDVVNWRKVRVGGKDVLTLVVLREEYTVPVDDFASRADFQYRVLRLVDNVYTSEIWRKPTAEAGGYQLVEGPFTPRNASGQTYDEIPFRFIGPRKNGTEIEKPPMYDLCSLNMSHYRNSADYEEACFITGQPTVWAGGLTQQWVKEVLGGKVLIGARGILPLPEGGAAGILQPEPNTLPFEAMQHKEKQMQALGAKLVEQRSVQRTATETQADEDSESSVLSSTARNVSKGFLWALQWCGYFVGVPESAIKFQLNTDFDLAQMSPAERLQLMKEWQGEAITYSEMRAALRRTGVATLTDEEAMAQIEQDRVFFAPEDDGQDGKDPVDDGAE